ncbi:guanine nucleotide exchange protein smcr8a-like [Diadema antillarum]|uniref:guanine nucleotide exchange protein smcr8a-like n=1 Tax=Diadema antillarum TaxID=105358 RepID=UPI003A8513D4
MLGGVPQVAFYGHAPEMNYFDAAKDEAAFVRSRPPLPIDLAQSYRPPNPWPVSPTCGKDFILVCEFSELEGPKPLITIPKDGGSSFDKNMYAVKIMAVDYNATNYARTTNTFKLSEDTAVIMEDRQEGTYSYIHHFTLYDIHARGFVRPFCMAYITADKNKLRSNLQHIMSCFNQVSQYYRYGNYVIFREEMVRRLADLIYTKEIIKTQLEETEQKQEARVERARRHKHRNNHTLNANSNSNTNSHSTTNSAPNSHNPTHDKANPTVKTARISSSGSQDDETWGLLDECDGENEEEEVVVVEAVTKETDDVVEKEQDSKPGEEPVGDNTSIVDIRREEEEIIAELKEYARKREELESAEKGIREIEVILEAVNPALKKNKKMEMRYRRLQERYSENPTTKTKPPPPKNLHKEGYCSDEDTPRPPQRNRIRKRSSSHSEVVEETDSNNDPNAPYQPQMVRTVNPRRFDRSLRTLHELCSYGAKEGLNRLRKLLKFYCRDANVLHLEKQESSLVEPSVSLLTIGRTVTVNFLNAINLQCMANCHWDPRGLTESISLDSFSSCQEDSSPFESLPPSYEARFVMGSSYASLESLYYEVGESMEDLFLSPDPKMPANLPGNHSLFIEDSFGSWIDISQADQHRSSSDSSSCSFHSVSSDTRDQPSLPLPSCPNPSKLPSVNDSNEEEEEEVEEEDVVEEEEKEEEAEEGEGISMGTTSSRGDSISKTSEREEGSSVDSLERYNNSVPSTEEPVLQRNSRVPVGCYASRLSSVSVDLPGSGIKDFITRYVFAVHLIYALLSGRTVVIAASPVREREVNALIRTLWLFVPGHSSRYHLVVPWHTKPLCMADLSRMKLVGLAVSKSVSRVVPGSVRRYITLFDFDQSTLYTPPYKGTCLDAIVSRHKHFQTDQSYLAYIQSVLLELASKAFLYYHSYCLNSPNSQLVNSTSSGDSYQRPTNTPPRVSPSSFLAKLGLMDGDSRIVEYWVELIKRQQIDEILQKQGCSTMPNPSIRLDHRMCSRYQI